MAAPGGRPCSCPRPRSAPLTGGPSLSTDLLAIVVSVVAFVVSGFFLLALMPERRAGDSAAPVPVTIEASIPVPIANAGAEARPIAAVAVPHAAAQLPVEHDGVTRQIAVDLVVAVRANAHYTYLYDGRAEHFCPLAIGEIEARLDPDRFVRVHRSHIVNLDHISRLKRAGDNGVIELDGPERLTIPVSRSRFSAVRSRLRLKVA